MLALLGLVGIVSQRTISRLADDNRWVTHTYVVLEALQRLSHQVSQSEAAARGYVLTGSPQFESQYREVKENISAAVADLRNKSSDNPEQQKRIAQLELIIRERIAVLDNSVQIRKTQGLNAVLAISPSSRGPLLSSQIATQIQEIGDEENRLLATRNAKASQGSRRAFVVVLVAVLLAMAAVALSVFFMFRDLERRREVDRMKSEFISVVSHELRTPLTSLRGSLGLLGSGLVEVGTSKGRRMLEIAVNNTDRLIRLINDILDVEKLDSGRIEMPRKICNAGDLMRQTADAMRSMAQTHNVSLQISSNESRIFADPDRIVQCLTNLVSNGIKFSDPGGIVSICALRAGSALRFEVRDHGKGIPPANQRSIFERFHQVDVSDSRKKGGTGLGLAICRSIVQQHGGRIWVESTLGKGSTFVFTIPLAQVEQQNRHPNMAPQSSDSCVIQKEANVETRSTD